MAVATAQWAECLLSMCEALASVSTMQNQTQTTNKQNNEKPVSISHLAFLLPLYWPLVSPNKQLTMAKHVLRRPEEEKSTTEHTQDSLLIAPCVLEYSHKFSLLVYGSVHKPS